MAPSLWNFGSSIASAAGSSINNFTKDKLLPAASTAASSAASYTSTTLAPVLYSSAKSTAIYGATTVAPALYHGAATTASSIAPALYRGASSTANALAPVAYRLHKSGKKQLPSLMRKAKKIKWEAKKIVRPLMKTAKPYLMNVEKKLPGGKEVGKWVGANPRLSALVAINVAGTVLPVGVTAPVVWIIRLGGWSARAGAIMVMLKMIFGEQGVQGWMTLLKTGVWEIWVGKQVLKFVLIGFQKIVEGWILV